MTMAKNRIMKRNTDNMEIKRRSTFAILFYINRTKVRKDGTCQLLCKISIDAKWEQIGTKVSVNPAIWNPEKGRADGRSENAITVNRAIAPLSILPLTCGSEIMESLYMNAICFPIAFSVASAHLLILCLLIRPLMAYLP